MENQKEKDLAVLIAAISKDPTLKIKTFLPAIARLLNEAVGDGNYFFIMNSGFDDSKINMVSNSNKPKAENMLRLAIEKLSQSPYLKTDNKPEIKVPENIRSNRYKYGHIDI